MNVGTRQRFEEKLCVKNTRIKEKAGNCRSREDLLLHRWNGMEECCFSRSRLKRSSACSSALAWISSNNRCVVVVGPDELNHLPTTVDGAPFNSFSTISSFASPAVTAPFSMCYRVRARRVWISVINSLVSMVDSFSYCRIAENRCCFHGSSPHRAVSTIIQTPPPRSGFRKTSRPSTRRLIEGHRKTRGRRAT